MSRALATPATGLTHVLKGDRTGDAAPTGASNEEPSRRATTASDTSADVRTRGGAAGRSTSRAALPTTASTTRSMTLSTTARASVLPRAPTGPGIVDASLRR